MTTKAPDGQGRPGVVGAAASLARAQEVIRGIVASRYDRPSLVADIACEIGAQIVEGIVHPGQDLNTVELARHYRSSRTPVREALMLLESEGLVDIPPRRRPRAHVPTMVEVREIYRTRTVLFELMATDSARSATEADIAVLNDILDRMRRAVATDDVVNYAWLSVEFHDRDTAMSGNATAKRIHDSLLLRTLSMRRLSVGQPGRLQKSLDDHIQLVRAYEAHDSHLAGAILRANHIASLAGLERYYERTGSLVAPRVDLPDG